MPRSYLHSGPNVAPYLRKEGHVGPPGTRHLCPLVFPISGEGSPPVPGDTSAPVPTLLFLCSDSDLTPHPSSRVLSEPSEVGWPQAIWGAAPQPVTGLTADPPGPCRVI